MNFTIRQHAGTALVAVAVVVASLFDGAFEPTAYAVGSIAIWAAVLAGLVSRGLPASPISAPAAAAGLCLAGVVLLSGLSIGWAGDQGRAFQEAVRVSAYLGLFILAACTASESGRGHWLNGLTLGLSVVGGLAVLSYLQPGLLDDRALDRLIPGAGSRLSYPIGYWNGLAAMLAFAAVLLARAGLRAPGPRWRAAAVAAMPVMVVGIWFTGSRGALLALLVGLAALIAASPERPLQAVPALIGAAGAGVAILVAERFQALMDGLTTSAGRSEGDWMSLILIALVAVTGAAALLADRRELRPRLSRRTWTMAGALVAVAAVAAIVAADPAERFDQFTDAPPQTAAPGAAPIRSDFNGSGRWQFWGQAIDAFDSAPVAGVGAGAYEDWWASHATASLFVRNPHSLPLQQLAELGLLGAALLLGFAAAVLLAARRWLLAGAGGDSDLLLALLAAAAVAAAIDWGWQIPAVFAPALIAAGLLTASAPGSALRRDRYALGLGTVAIAWVAMFSAGLVVVTELKLDRSRSLAREGDIDGAIERAEEAHTVQPWSPEPYTQLALLEESRGDLDQAVLRLHQAQQRDSEDWRLAVIENRLDYERGDTAGARAAFIRAQTLNRLLPIVVGQPKGRGTG